MTELERIEALEKWVMQQSSSPQGTSTGAAALDMTAAAGVAHATVQTMLASAVSAGHAYHAAVRHSNNSAMAELVAVMTGVTQMMSGHTATPTIAASGPLMSSMHESPPPAPNLRELAVT
jgi:hypothetical protein